MSKENIKEEAQLGEKEVLSPVDKCLFLDLDMTLIDESYEITDFRIFESINTLQKEGWRIGLNSNTPLEPLLVWMQYFGMKGPVIAEKGAVIFDDNNAIFNRSLTKVVRASRKAIGRELETTNIQWLSGNPVDIIRQNKFEGLRPGSVVLLNTVRKCSLSYYVREITSGGQAVINPDITIDIVERLCKYCPDADSFEDESNLAKGIFLIMPRGQTKRLGTLTFMKNEGLTQVGIIGDSMNDFLGEDKAVHYAVGNAKDDYKAKAAFVSRFSMTKGCVNILRQLTRQGLSRRNFPPDSGNLLG